MRETIEKLFDEARTIGPEPSGQLSIGFTCTYIPTEILEAAGLRPHRIRPEPSSEKADAYLDPNFCPYARACLGQAMSGGYDKLAGVVTANSCDAMRRLHDAWRFYSPRGFHFLLDVPRIINGQAVKYFSSRLKDLISTLQSYFGTQISQQELHEALQEANRTRALLDTLFSLRKRKKLNYGELLLILDKQWKLPRHRYNYVLERIIEIVLERSPVKSDGPRVFVTGSILDGNALIDVIEELGANVVGVDCCMAERVVPRVELGKDAVEELARSYLGKVPCSRMKDLKKRSDYIVQKISETGASGLIYTTLKFCDPYLYEWPFVMDEMHQRGVPVLYLEGEYQGRVGGGTRTRIQAFVEMLEARKFNPGVRSRSAEIWQKHGDFK